MSKRILTTMLLVLLLGLLLAACGGAEEQPVAPPVEEQPVAPTIEQAAPAASEGKALLEERCTKCHSLERVELARKTKGEWNSTLERMLENGAQLSQAEQEQLVQYLVETYPK